MAPTCGCVDGVAIELFGLVSVICLAGRVSREVF